MEHNGKVAEEKGTVFGVLKGVAHSLDALEFEAILEPSIFWIIVEVILLNSVAGVKLIDLWLGFGVDLFLSEMSIADFLAIGVRLFPLLGRVGAVNLAGEDGTLDVLA